jgi:tripartite-type tricarboxylate transporter receptor subunit TctC
MILARRSFLHLAASSASVPVLMRAALALDYPTRPVHLVVGFPPGTAPDTVARLVSEPLGQRFGQQFVVDNRPGASGNIATGFVAAASPDGYTLLLLLSTTAVNAALYKNLSFDFARDIVPIGMIGTNSFVLVVSPSLPVKTLPEFIAYAKANRGINLFMASLGVGTTPHVCGELLRMMTGINFVHVPYSGTLMPDLLAGRVQFYFSPTPQAITYIKDGRLRALGVTSTKRLASLPDVPAISEFVPGYEVTGWIGLGAPRATSNEVVDRLNEELAAIDADADPKIKARFLALGIEAKAMTPNGLETFVTAEIKKWSKVIKFAGIKPSGSG